MKEKTRQILLSNGRKALSRATPRGVFPHTAEEAIGLGLLGVKGLPNNTLLNALGVDQYHYNVGCGATSKAVSRFGFAVWQTTRSVNYGPTTRRVFVARPPSL